MLRHQTNENKVSKETICSEKKGEKNSYNERKADNQRVIFGELFQSELFLCKLDDIK